MTKQLRTVQSYTSWLRKADRLTGNLKCDVQAISCHEGVRFEVHQDRPAVAVEVKRMVI